MKFDTKSTYLIINKKIQYALAAETEKIDKKTKLELGPINQNNKRQLWLFQTRKDSTFEIVNGFSDFVLTEDKGGLHIEKGKSNKHQLWHIDYVRDSDVVISIMLGTKRFLSIDNGELVMRQDKVSQEIDVWQLVKVQNNESLNKSCFIVSKDTGYNIDVPESTKQNGAQPLIYQPNYRFNQRWNLLRAGQIYVIKSFYNELNLDIFQQRIQNDTKIIQWVSHGRFNQFWRFQKIDPKTNQFRIYTCSDKEIELGHKHHKLVLHKGRKFTWLIDGYLPE